MAYFRNFLAIKSVATLAANKPSIPGSGTDTGGGTATPARAVAESIETHSPVMRCFIVNLPCYGLTTKTAFFRPGGRNSKESIT
jgi:hypothetical protein